MWICSNVVCVCVRGCKKSAFIKLFFFKSKVHCLWNIKKKNDLFRWLVCNLIDLCHPFQKQVKIKQTSNHWTFGNFCNHQENFNASSAWKGHLNRFTIRLFDFLVWPYNYSYTRAWNSKLIVTLYILWILDIIHILV